MDSTDFGETTRMTSAFAAAGEYFDSDNTDEMDSKIVGGNDRLAKTLVQLIAKGGGAVHFKSRVTTVHQPRIGSKRVAKNAIQVKVAGRKAPYRADFVIALCPLPV